MSTDNSKKKTNRKRRGRGEGSIFQRRDGLWEGKVSIGCDGAGKPSEAAKWKQELQIVKP